jgi:hypothetical protein
MYKKALRFLGAGGAGGLAGAAAAAAAAAVSSRAPPTITCDGSSSSSSSSSSIACGPFGAAPGYGEGLDGVQVEKVVVITRHGDRTPAFWSNRRNSIGNQRVSEREAAFWSQSNEVLVPTPAVTSQWSRYCPWQESNAPSVTGTLTWLGAATQQANGVWLRARYVDALGFLPAQLRPEDVEARSTPFPRCVQSCQQLLLGLYPVNARAAPKNGSGSSSHLTPVLTFSRGWEPMYGIWFCSCDSCPRAIQVLHEICKLPGPASCAP